jgi:hypothetical protein
LDPIGVTGIESKEPAVVTLAVAAQILQLQPQSSQRRVAPMSILEKFAAIACACLLPRWDDADG